MSSQICNELCQMFFCWCGVLVQAMFRDVVDIKTALSMV